MPRTRISLAKRQEGLCSSDQGNERKVSAGDNQDDWVFKDKNGHWCYPKVDLQCAMSCTLCDLPPSLTPHIPDWKITDDSAGSDW